MARRIRQPQSSEITPEALYLRRREFIRTAGLTLATATGVGGALSVLTGSRPRADRPQTPPPELPAASPRITTYTSNEPSTPYESVSTYNNFYEFGLDKRDPAENADSLVTRPWIVRATGELARERTLDIEWLLRRYPLEERVYRFRCVEAWSMVIPWLGFPLSSLIHELEPSARAKYVVFETLLDPEQMPGQRSAVLEWPYVEALRLDEAIHPLTFVAVGLYGKALPNQNGAPLRLVVPWKYGFKSIKSIVTLRFTHTMPATTWNRAAPSEYGFYANVNPFVPHPRWSQASERRIGELARRPTLAFNGYGEDVQHLYRGLDLRKNF